LSHVVCVECEFRDLDALKAACKRLNLEFKEGQTSYTWYGAWVDDSPVPEHLFDPDEAQRVKAMTESQRKAYMNAFLGHCQHAIACPGTRYEVGVVQKNDERGTRYHLVWDWIDQALFERLGTEKGHHFAQAYEIEAIKRQAHLQGYTAAEQQLENGSVQVTIQT
jgi:hypothetical protein